MSADPFSHSTEPSSDARIQLSPANTTHSRQPLRPITCSEDVPRIRVWTRDIGTWNPLRSGHRGAENVSAETRGASLANYRVRQRQASCKGHGGLSRAGMRLGYAIIVPFLFALAAPLSVAASTSKDGPVAEPSGYWTGPVNSRVPDTLTGGKVIRKARELRALMRQGGAVIVDVSNAPRRPEHLAPGAPWLPLPHRAIPGSMWIPGVGLGEVPVSVDDFFRERLAAATGDHLARPLVIYCHRNCWLSWNAAKRAISYGYRNVYWFRSGIEGWRAAGFRTAVIEPQFAPEGSDARVGRAAP